MLCETLSHAVKPTRVYPRSQTVWIGGKAVFVCYSFSKVKWTHQEGQLKPNVITSPVLGIKAHQIKIKSVQIYNAGKYTCSGSDINDYYFNSDAFLKVLGK